MTLDSFLLFALRLATVALIIVATLGLLVVLTALLARQLRANLRQIAGSQKQIRRIRQLEQFWKYAHKEFPRRPMGPGGGAA